MKLYKEELNNYLELYMTISPNVKILGLRFLRVFGYYFIGGMATLSPVIIKSWQDLGSWIGTLILVGTGAGIAGLIGVLDKSRRLPLPEELQ